MAYVNVPKDLTKVKTKVLFNLTKRQLICFGSGALIGVPLFFLLKGSIGTSPAAMVMMVVVIVLPGLRGGGQGQRGEGEQGGRQAERDGRGEHGRVLWRARRAGAPEP